VKIAIGSDHAGFRMKKQLLRHMEKSNHSVVDVGAYDARPSDYPDSAAAVGHAIEAGADRGVLVCGSGVGASIAANKIPGIRAGLCHESYLARQGVEHDDMNVLVLGSRVIAPELAKLLLDEFLAARFIPKPRYVRRLEKVLLLESRFHHKASSASPA
jgi:ribose 5-phosphate isomerase B